MAEDGEEDDYMGDLSRFLQPQELLKSTQISEASYPSQSQGLSKNQRKKLRTELIQKTEDEKRSEGLSSAISSSNIGFKMLQQMGYNPGKALGKHEQGTLEPLNVDVKRSRSGLGRDEIEKAKAIAKAKAKALADDAKRGITKQKRDELESGFRERRKSNWQGYKLFRDYRKAQTALQHLEGSPRQHKVPQEEDLENLQGNYLQDGSGKDASDGPEENESDEEIELQDLLDLLTRLRSQYFYCLYCGCKYENADSLQSNCPGMEEEDH